MASQAGGAQGRVKGQRPFPDRPEGTNTLPQIDHILVLMMENHTYDNYLGMLGRRLRQPGLAGDVLFWWLHGFPSATLREVCLALQQ